MEGMGERTRNRERERTGRKKEDRNDRNTNQADKNTRGTNENIYTSYITNKQPQSNKQQNYDKLNKK